MSSYIYGTGTGDSATMQHIMDSFVCVEDIELLERWRAEKNSIPQTFRAKRLPEFPAGLKLHPSDMQFRTYNCLEQAGFAAQPELLGGRTVGELLKLSNFGSKSLLDLFRVLRPWLPKRYAGGSGASEYLAAEPELLREAKHLSDLTYSDLVHREDPRFGHLIRRLDASASSAGDVADRFLSGTSVPVHLEQYRQGLCELREALEGSFNIFLEDELNAFTQGVISARNQSIIVRRYGLDGKEPATLEEVGQPLQLERERIRQICKKFTHKLTGSPPVFAPILTRALEFVSAFLPGKAEDIEARLMAEGLARNPFRLEALKSAADLLDLGVPFNLTQVGSERVALPVGAEYNAKRVLTVARRAMEQHGVATVHDVAATAAEQSSLPVEVVIGILTGQVDFVCGRRSGWFWPRSWRATAYLIRLRRFCP